MTIVMVHISAVILILFIFIMGVLTASKRVYRVYYKNDEGITDD